MCIRDSTHTHTHSEPSGEHDRKRYGSHSKNIALEVAYKTKDGEQKITISPAHRTQKKSIEWLRALKKVRVDCLYPCLYAHMTDM